MARPYTRRQIEQEGADGWGSAKAVLKTGLLLGLALYFAAVVLTGNLKNYTDPQFTWLAITASLLFALLGLVSGYDVLKARGMVGGRSAANHLHDHGHDHEHDHNEEESQSALAEQHNYSHGHSHSGQHVSWPVLAVVAIPLALGTLVPSRPLNSAALSGNLNAGTIPAGISSGAIGPSIDDPTGWNILDWQRAFSYQMQPPDWFDGRQADVVGFVDHPGGLPTDHFVLARWVMYHCAVDARGIGMLVVWKGSAELQRDTWVQVRGTIEVEPFAGQTVLILHAANVDTVAEPDFPYLRPYAFRESVNKTPTPASTSPGTAVSLEKLDLSVQLPGSGWTKSIVNDYPRVENERWQSADKSLQFAAFLFADEQPGSSADLKEFAEDLAYEFQVAQVVDTREESFQGHVAIRIEGVGLDQQETFPEGYRFVEYWLQREEGVYLIVAGSSLTQWQSGGEGRVKAVLDSVRFTR